MTILDQLAQHAKMRTELAKQRVSAEEIRRQARNLPKGTFEFEKSLRKEGLSFICECKKASPSKGLISPDFPYLDIAAEYEAAGADCISVLTEPEWFQGSDRYLKEIAEAVSIPCLRKEMCIRDSHCTAMLLRYDRVFRSPEPFVVDTERTGFSASTGRWYHM